jgi:rhomboid protease GluP
LPLPPRWRYKLDRWRESLSSAFRSEPKQARPRLCPSCGTLVGATATRCHQCGASMNFSLAAASRSLSGLLPSQSPATYIIMAVNFLLFVVSWLRVIRLGGQLGLMSSIPGQILYPLGASMPLGYLIRDGEWWRLVTASFLHGGLLHIATNTWGLMYVGPQVEEAYGSARYLFIYVFTGVFGFLASSFTGHFSVGASASLMGLIGVMLAMTSRHGGAYSRMIRSQLILWVGYTFVAGFMFAGVDNTAHIGGLAAGYLLGRVMEDREPISAQERQGAYALGWLAGIVVIASFVFMLMNYFRIVGQPVA